ncbi:MAG: septum formation initiator family protein [Lactobacillus sp.]|jgi:cell division protein DivIC|nr:septum formation initiator family protein [Lactobacillus sp.]MCI2034053.1 septum formation initiator family protein [Lactobacillus sp.]
MQQSKIKFMPKTPRLGKPQMNQLHRRRVRLLLGLLAVILMIGGWQLYCVHAAINKSDQSVATARTELRQVKAKKADLKVQVDQLRNSDYLAKLVRQKYMVSKSGEVIFELPGTASKLTTPTSDN